ncbi:cytochrome c [Myxococcota bacterium]|nr:cytochrome c [Myxococcota bacterium]MCZ7619792.1 cytochrome c [Myxococcota bacterium]
MARRAGGGGRTPAAWAVAAALLLAAAAAGPAAAEAISGPRLDYVLHCMGCHLEDGGGAPESVPTLEGFGRFLQIPDGRAYLVRVPGSAHAPLDDAALAALLNWMLVRFDPTRARAPEFRPYEAAEVTRYRAVPLADADAERRRLLRVLDGDPSGDR